MVVEAVGRPQTWKQAFYARDLAGTVVLVGVPTPEMKLPDLPLVDVFSRGGALKSSWYGDCLPSRDFPMLVDLYRQGRLDLDAFVTEEIKLDEVGRVRADAPRRRTPLGGDRVTARVDHGVTSGTSEWLRPLDIGETRRRSCEELDRGFRSRVDSRCR